MTSQPVFSPAHIAWLLGIAFTAAWLANLTRRNRLPSRALRVVLGCLLAGTELQRYFHDGLEFPGNLPLQPCNVTAWVAVLACITLSPLAVEYVYFVGLAGAGMAVITPDMGADWPARFFISHGVLIVTACVLTFGNFASLRQGAVWRVFGVFAAGAALMGIFDYVFGVNYLYLRAKPRSVSAFNLLGPWPVYILSAALLALSLFWLLWLPWRFSGGQHTAQDDHTVGWRDKVPRSA